MGAIQFSLDRLITIIFHALLLILLINFKIPAFPIGQPHDITTLIFLFWIITVFYVITFAMVATALELVICLNEHQLR